MRIGTVQNEIVSKVIAAKSAEFQLSVPRTCLVPQLAMIEAIALFLAVPQRMESTLKCVEFVGIERVDCNREPIDGRYQLVHVIVDRL